MSTDTSDPDRMTAAQRFLTDLIDGYRHLDTSPRRYALTSILPTVLLAVLLVVLTLLTIPTPIVVVPVVLLSGLLPLVAVIYPKIRKDRRSRRIRGQFHLFLTHITVLSLTNIERVEVFRTLAKIDEYGPLADEMAQITALVDTWNQSLDDACRRRSQQVSSEILSDFLERMAYTLSAGQPLDKFLVNEQSSIINQFAISYEADLDKLDVLKELYLSLVMAMVFLLVFGAVIPILIGVPATVIVGGTVLLFGAVQMGFIVILNSVAPQDPVWLREGGNQAPLQMVRTELLGALALTLVLAVGMLALVSGVTPLPRGVLPHPLYVAIPVTPLLWPGWKMHTLEREVKRRDDEFGPFIRALGSVESVKQTSTANVLKTLRQKNFGALTTDINRLYRRLRVRIDTTEAWRLFGIETGSFLIRKFADMYVVGRRMGGDPQQLGDVLSENFERVLQVREHREQQATTLIGVIYGITAAAMFAAFVGLGVVEQMLTITDSIPGQNSRFIGSLFSAQGYRLWIIELLMLTVLVLNALLSSLMIRVSDRGHLVNALPHFVGLTWTGAIVATVTRRVAQAVIG